MSQTIVITGSSSGIGFALANYLSKKGNLVFGLSRKIPSDASFTTIATDITDKQQVTDAILQIIAQTNKIDVLINNAGMGMVGAIENASAEEIIQLFRLNLIGCTHLYSSVFPEMRKQKSGKVINISSIGSEMGLPFRGYYSASKAALDKTTEALRYEVKNFGIQVCTLNLGDIQTNIAENRIKSIVDDAYQEVFNKVYTGMNSHVNDGISPENVAYFVEKLIAKKSLKPHYYYGKFGQKISIILKKILPQLWFEKMIAKYSGV